MGMFDKLKKSINESAGNLKNQVENLQEATKDVKIPDSVKDFAQKGGSAFEKFKANSIETAQAAKAALLKETDVSNAHKGEVSVESALKVVYFLMAVDNSIDNEEMDKFESIGLEMDPSFAEHKEDLIEGCQKVIDACYDQDDYFDTIHDAVGDVLKNHSGESGWVRVKWLLWNLLAVAYSDNEYSKDEIRLVRYAAKVMEIDQTIVKEFDSTIQTLIAVENEEKWLKSSNRPYSVVEAQVNELENRKNVIMQGVRALIFE